MKNKVIIIGDSYAFGHGCSDRIHYYDQNTKKWIGNPDFFLDGPSQHCWAGLAKSDFPKFEFINLAKPGNSNDNMFKELSETIDENVALVIFSGTFANRMLIKSDVIDKNEILPWIVGAYWLEMEINRPKSYISSKEAFIKHLYHDAMGENYAILSILAAWATSILYKSKFIWSFPLEETMLTNRNLTLAHMKNLQFPGIARYPFVTTFGVDQYSVVAADGHINDYGHRLYYDQEIKPLLTTLLA